MSNPFLLGGFAPVEQESDCQQLKVIGEIPAQLRGTFVRNGPNPIDPTQDDCWFVGPGMLHGINLVDGKASWYRNRWLRSGRMQAKLKEIPTEPVQTPGNAAVNVYALGGRLLALGEVGAAIEFDANLKSLGRFDFDGAHKGNISAHPRFDPATGESWFVCYNFAPPFVQVLVADRNGKLIRSEGIETRRPTMIHECLLTEHWLIFLDSACVMDAEQVSKRIKGHAVMPFSWQPELGARLVLCKRDFSVSPIQIEIDPCYIYHSFNSYEAPGADGQSLIVMDVIVYSETFSESALGPIDSNGYAERWTINPFTKSVIRERLSDERTEFPAINRRLAQSKNQYGYAISANWTEGPQLGGLIKYDFGRREIKEFRATRSFEIGGEATFVADKSRVGEDAGWLLAFGRNQISGQSDFLIIDAADPDGAAVARVEIPVDIPHGFHSGWISQERGAV